jgi:hypothetical protein
MDDAEKVRRALLEEYEFHGDTKHLIKLLREELLKRRMTDQEKEAMSHLVNFWNAYTQLPPSIADPSCSWDVQIAVHTIQGALAMRVAGRCNPEIWRH